jgi:cytochrome oxidase Cu insertion factor (SCO1/SenC/PrrC family)
MRPAIPALFLSASLLGFAGCSSGTDVGGAAPDFSLKDLDGDPVKLSDFRGKVVLLNFWFLR